MFTCALYCLLGDGIYTGDARWHGHHRMDIGIMEDCFEESTSNWHTRVIIVIIIIAAAAAVATNLDVLRPCCLSVRYDLRRDDGFPLEATWVAG